jgi:hypothetical protein
MWRIDEYRLLQHGRLACGVVAALLALASALSGAAGATLLSIRLGIFAAVAVITGVIIHRRAAAVAHYRRLDAVQRAALLADLRIMSVLPTPPVTISAPAADDEAKAYAAALLEVFQDSLWPARGIRLPARGIRLDEVEHNTANVDVLVAIRDPEQPPQEVLGLLLALQRVGIRAASGVSQRLDHRGIELFVGRLEP